jgi:hypothetical protein
MVSFTTLPLYHQGKGLGTHWLGDWGGVDWTTWRREHFLPYWNSNSNPLVVQAVASRYTDYDIPAPNWYIVNKYTEQTLFSSKKAVENPPVRYVLGIPDLRIYDLHPWCCGRNPILGRPATHVAWCVHTTLLSTSGSRHMAN